jgi:hypothetical protein
VSRASRCETANANAGAPRTAPDMLGGEGSPDVRCNAPEPYHFGALGVAGLDAALAGGRVVSESGKQGEVRGRGERGGGGERTHGSECVSSSFQAFAGSATARALARTRRGSITAKTVYNLTIVC